MRAMFAILLSLGLAALAGPASAFDLGCASPEDDACFFYGMSPEFRGGDDTEARREDRAPAEEAAAERQRQAEERRQAEQDAANATP